MKIKIALIILLTTQIVKGQSENRFLGTWIKYGSVPDNVIEDPFTDKKFIKYEFRENGLVYYSNSFLERGVPGKYELVDDHSLSLNFTMYNILSFTEIELILSANSNDTIRLVKTEKLKVGEKDSVSISNIVYKSNFRLRPVLNASANLYDYFFGINDYLDELSATHSLSNAARVMNQNTGNVYDDLSAKINFVVDRKGNVKNIKIVESTNSRKNSHFVYKIEKTSGYWTPAKLNGAFVDAEVTLVFKKLGLTTIENLETANNLFEKARKNYEKGNYDKALEMVTKALSIDPTNQQYLLGRANAYFALNKNAQGCEDLNRISDHSIDEVNQLKLERCKK